MRLRSKQRCDAAAGSRPQLRSAARASRAARSARVMMPQTGPRPVTARRLPATPQLPGRRWHPARAPIFDRGPRWPRRSRRRAQEWADPASSLAAGPCIPRDLRPGVLADQADGLDWVRVLALAHAPASAQRPGWVAQDWSLRLQVKLLVRQRPAPRQRPWPPAVPQDQGRPNEGLCAAASLWRSADPQGAGAHHPLPSPSQKASA